MPADSRMHLFHHGRPLQAARMRRPPRSAPNRSWRAAAVMSRAFRTPLPHSMAGLQPIRTHKQGTTPDENRPLLDSFVLRIFATSIATAGVLSKEFVRLFMERHRSILALPFAVFPFERNQ